MIIHAVVYYYEENDDDKSSNDNDGYIDSILQWNIISNNGRIVKFGPQLFLIFRNQILFLCIIYLDSLVFQGYCYGQLRYNPHLQLFRYRYPRRSSYQ